MKPTITLIKSILIGGLLALILISLFLYGVKNPKPEWGQYWMIRPLLIVPIAGALGGAFYYIIQLKLNKTVWYKILAFILGLVGYIFALWIGIILGLDGTLWD